MKKNALTRERISEELATIIIRIVLSRCKYYPFQYDRTECWRINMEVALYARVSSDKQDVDLSISAQLKALHEYAKRMVIK